MLLNLCLNIPCRGVLVSALAFSWGFDSSAGLSTSLAKAVHFTKTFSPLTYRSLEFKSDVNVQ